MFGDRATSGDRVSDCGDRWCVCDLGEYIRVFFPFLGLMRGCCPRASDSSLGY